MQFLRFASWPLLDRLADVRIDIAIVVVIVAAEIVLHALPAVHEEIIGDIVPAASI